MSIRPGSDHELTLAIERCGRENVLSGAKAPLERARIEVQKVRTFLAQEGTGEKVESP